MQYCEYDEKIIINLNLGLFYVQLEQFHFQLDFHFLNLEKSGCYIREHVSFCAPQKE